MYSFTLYQKNLNEDADELYIVFQNDETSEYCYLEYNSQDENACDNFRHDYKLAKEAVYSDCLEKLKKVNFIKPLIEKTDKEADEFEYFLSEECDELYDNYFYNRGNFYNWGNFASEIFDENRDTCYLGIKYIAKMLDIKLSINHIENEVYRIKQKITVHDDIDEFIIYAKELNEIAGGDEEEIENYNNLLDEFKNAYNNKDFFKADGLLDLDGYRVHIIKTNDKYFILEERNIFC